MKLMFQVPTHPSISDGVRLLGFLSRTKLAKVRTYVKIINVITAEFGKDCSFQEPFWYIIDTLYTNRTVAFHYNTDKFINRPTLVFALVGL